jgi:hypothetical protein
MNRKCCNADDVINVLHIEGSFNAFRSSPITPRVNREKAIVSF